MPETRKTVFISCGQFASHERELGKQICKLVSECTPFDGYFAEDQTTLQALSENVLRRLYNSIGLIVVMHHRGMVVMPSGEKIPRASVWIEQEIALATLMEQILHRPLLVQFFAEKGIARDGIRQQIQLNAFEFTTSDEVIARLREILPTWRDPLYESDEEIRKLMDSVELAITVEDGFGLGFNIRVENLSDIDVEIKDISLWSGDDRLCKPLEPPDGTRWSVPARLTVPIRLVTGVDVGLYLIRLYGPSTGSPFPAVFRAPITVKLRCDVTGLERKFAETTTVQVVRKDHKIIGN